MIQVLSAAGANAVSALFSGEDNRASRLIVEVTEPSSAVFSLKFKARVIGRGHKNSLGKAVADMAGYLVITNLLTGALIAGGTGITDAGMYSIDVSGMEGVFEFTWTSGTVSVWVVPTAAS